MGNILGIKASSGNNTNVSYMAEKQTEIYILIANLTWLDNVVGEDNKEVIQSALFIMNCNKYFFIILLDKVMPI